MNSVGIIGYGAFGKLMADLIGQYVTVVVSSRRTLERSQLPALGRQGTIEEVAKCSVIIIACNLTDIESVCEQLKDLVTPQTIVLDVCSVKVKPAEVMQRVLGDKCRLLATHPLFGPQTVELNHGTKGLKMVWYELVGGPFPELESVCRDTLGLEIIRMTPEEHDKEMAWVHGLTFFVGRALLNMQPPDSPLATLYYNELMDVVAVEKDHTYELFMSIQQGNPFADDIRKQFMQNLQQLEDGIISGRITEETKV